MENKIQHSAYTTLKDEIGKLLQEGRKEAGRAVNHILINTYWNMGQYIVEFEQEGSEKAVYGSELLDRLSKDLTSEFGKGFSRSNLFQIRQFYIRFPKIQTLSGQLSWSHYIELMKEEDELAVSFYMKQCDNENWSVRELKRQMKSMLFHRIALSRQKSKVIEIAQKGVEVQRAEDIIKDPYVFEFLDIPVKSHYLEGELEEKLIQNLESFLLELGKRDFAK